MIFILIASENDRPFIEEGLKHLREKSIKHDVIVGSTHREPEETAEKIKRVIEMQPAVIIAGAATATGLPGVCAGHLLNTNIPIIGVRFSKNPGTDIIEDASFNLSGMPKEVPLLYAGYNEKGFLHACMMAVRIIY